MLSNGLLLLLGAAAWALAAVASGQGAARAPRLVPRSRFSAANAETAAPGSLSCVRRKYNFKVTQADGLGRACWDVVSVSSCWGRCDSNEVSDWRFPYKRSHHPVCMHDVREVGVVTLRNCDADVEPGTERYEYLSAKACRCMVCKSTEAACQGVRSQTEQHKPSPGLLSALNAAMSSSVEVLGPVEREELELLQTNEV